MKRAFSFVCVAALAGLGLVACRPPKPDPPVYVCDAEAGPAADSVAAASADVDEPPLAPEQAGEEAKAAFAGSDVHTPDGRVPIVTVEEGPNGPEILSTPVASEAEAEAVAEQAAADGDLTVVEADSVVTADVDPDDMEFDEQYAFDLMDFVDTWQVDNPNNFTGQRAGGGQVVAIIDTGVHASHEDLVGRVLPGFSRRPAHEGVATTDLNGHGTRLAGIVAAETDNSVGIAGAAPAAQILPVKVLNEHGRGLSSDVANGILDAVDYPASVINLSLGGANQSLAQHLAVQYARSFGIPVIASSGNDGKCGPASYPAAFPEVLAVAAVDQQEDWAAFSTTGPYVNVAAPGAAILSTCPPGLVPPSAPPCPMAGYNTGNGTSFAAPYVSATAAIMRAVNPLLTPDEVYVCLMQTADDRPPLPGWDPETGFGLVDPFAAVYNC